MSTIAFARVCRSILATASLLVLRWTGRRKKAIPLLQSSSPPVSWWISITSPVCQSGAREDGRCGEVRGRCDPGAGEACCRRDGPGRVAAR